MLPCDGRGFWAEETCTSQCAGVRRHLRGLRGSGWLWRGRAAGQAPGLQAGWARGWAGRGSVALTGRLVRGWVPPPPLLQCWEGEAGARLPLSVRPPGLHLPVLGPLAWGPGPGFVSWLPSREFLVLIVREFLWRVGVG